METKEEPITVKRPRDDAEWHQRLRDAFARIEKKMMDRGGVAVKDLKIEMPFFRITDEDR